MLGANSLTEDRFTSEELNKCSELELSIGNFVLFRGEQCTVTSVKPLVFDWEEGWTDKDYRGEPYAIGYYDLGMQ